MTDDWRLRVVLEHDDQAAELAARLARFESEHQLKGSFGDRVVVSRDGSEVFCYADTREQAEAAGQAIRSLASEHQWQLTTELRRWHPVAEEWEDPDTPLPNTEAELAAEHAEVIQAERQESAAQGFPAFEVRVHCPTRRDAEQLAERLRGQGIENVHRWQFVVVGVADEDTAQQLAERIRGEAPRGTSVVAEGSTSEAAAEAPLATPFNNPFAVFGGLGG